MVSTTDPILLELEDQKPRLKDSILKAIEQKAEYNIIYNEDGTIIALSINQNIKDEADYRIIKSNTKFLLEAAVCFLSIFFLVAIATVFSIYIESRGL